VRGVFHFPCFSFVLFVKVLFSSSSTKKGRKEQHASFIRAHCRRGPLPGLLNSRLGSCVGTVCSSVAVSVLFDSDCSSSFSGFTLVDNVHSLQEMGTSIPAASACVCYRQLRRIHSELPLSQSCYASWCVLICCFTMGLTRRQRSRFCSEEEAC